MQSSDDAQMAILLYASHQDDDLRQSHIGQRLDHILGKRRKVCWVNISEHLASTKHPDIEVMLARASLVILFVSSELLNSEFFTGRGLFGSLGSAAQRGATIVWVPLRPSIVDGTPLAGYSPLWDPRRAISTLSLPEQDEAWLRIFQHLELLNTRELPSVEVLTKAPDASRSIGASRSQRLFGFPLLILLFLAAVLSYIGFVGHKLGRPVGSQVHPSTHTAYYPPDGGSVDAQHD